MRYPPNTRLWQRKTCQQINVKGSEMSDKEIQPETPKPKCCCEGRMEFCMCLAKGIHGDGSGAVFDYSTGREIQLSSSSSREKP